MQIPGFQAYPNAINPMPSRELDDPPASEGRQYASIEFDWLANGRCQQVNVALSSTRPFSRIVMIDVDNSESSVDVTFIWPDTQATLTVPAGTCGRFPATTSGTLFYGYAVQAPLSADKTRVNVLNYNSRPVDLSGGQYNSFAALGNVSLTATGNTVLISAGTVGILTGLTLQHWNAASGAGAGSATISINDGTNTFADAGIAAPANTMLAPGVLFEAHPFGVRFINGVIIGITAGGTALSSGSLVVNATYRVAPSL